MTSPWPATSCDQIAVAYAGELAEQGTAEQVLGRPAHPYAQRLLASMPRLQSDKMPVFIPGAPPDLRQVPPGCRFQPRCDEAMPSAQSGTQLASVCRQANRCGVGCTMKHSRAHRIPRQREWWTHRGLPETAFRPEWRLLARMTADPAPLGPASSVPWPRVVPAYNGMQGQMLMPIARIRNIDPSTRLWTWWPAEPRR